MIDEPPSDNWIYWVTVALYVHIPFKRLMLYIELCFLHFLHTILFSSCWATRSDRRHARTIRVSPVMCRPNFHFCHLVWLLMRSIVLMCGQLLLFPWSFNRLINATIYFKHLIILHAPTYMMPPHVASRIFAACWRPNVSMQRSFRGRPRYYTSRRTGSDLRRVVIQCVRRAICDTNFLKKDGP